MWLRTLLVVWLACNVECHKVQEAAQLGSRSMNALKPVQFEVFPGQSAEATPGDFVVLSLLTIAYFIVVYFVYDTQQEAAQLRILQALRGECPTCTTEELQAFSQYHNKNEWWNYLPKYEARVGVQAGGYLNPVYCFDPMAREHPSAHTLEIARLMNQLGHQKALEDMGALKDLHDKASHEDKGLTTDSAEAKLKELAEISEENLKWDNCDHAKIEVKENSGIVTKTLCVPKYIESLEGPVDKCNTKESARECLSQIRAALTEALRRASDKVNAVRPGCKTFVNVEEQKTYQDKVDDFVAAVINVLGVPKEDDKDDELKHLDVFSMVRLDLGKLSTATQLAGILTFLRTMAQRGVGGDNANLPKKMTWRVRDELQQTDVEIPSVLAFNVWMMGVLGVCSHEDIIDDNLHGFNKYAHAIRGNFVHLQTSVSHQTATPGRVDQAKEHIDKAARLLRQDGLPGSKSNIMQQDSRYLHCQFLGYQS